MHDRMGEDGQPLPKLNRHPTTKRVAKCGHDFACFHGNPIECCACKYEKRIAQLQQTIADQQEHICDVLETKELPMMLENTRRHEEMMGVLNGALAQIADNDGLRDRIAELEASNTRLKELWGAVEVANSELIEEVDNLKQENARLSIPEVQTDLRTAMAYDAAKSQFEERITQLEYALEEKPPDADAVRLASANRMLCEKLEALQSFAASIEGYEDGGLVCSSCEADVSLDKADMPNDSKPHSSNCRYIAAQHALGRDIP